MPPRPHEAYRPAVEPGIRACLLRLTPRRPSRRYLNYEAGIKPGAVQPCATAQERASSAVDADA